MPPLIHSAPLPNLLIYWYNVPMSQANELTTQIIDFLYSQGIFSWRASSTGIFDPKSQAYRTAPKKGVSDILAVLPPNGRLLAIEVKIGKDRTSPEQVGFLKNIQHVGGLTFIAKDFTEFQSRFLATMPATKPLSTDNT